MGLCDTHEGQGTETYLVLLSVVPVSFKVSYKKSLTRIRQVTLSTMGSVVESNTTSIKTASDNTAEMIYLIYIEGFDPWKDFTLKQT